MEPEQSIYNSPAYKKSRSAYIAQCTFEYFVALLVEDAFLAKLLSYIGVSDAWVGIISSFITLAFVIQLASIFLIKSRVSAKKLVITFSTISQLFFMFIYMVPFVPLSDTAKKALVVLSILAAYAGQYLISSICYKWANAYVSPDKRASYSATKEMVSLSTGILFTAAVGWVIDQYEGIGNLSGGFLFIAISILVINVCNFICLMCIKKESPEEANQSMQSLSNVIRYTLGNRDFRNITYLSILWEVARYFTVGFMGIFKTKDLMISVFAIQVINMVANFCRLLVSKPFGRYSDRTSFAKGYELGLYLAAVAFLVNVFTAPNQWYPVIAFTVFYSMSMAGINQNNFNISYSYVDSAYITQAIALKNSIAGLCGFGASFLGGKILAAIQNNGNSLWGVPMYGQQLLSFISFILVGAAILFTRLVIAKQKVKMQ